MTLPFAWTAYIAQSLLQLVVKLVAETIALCTHHGSNTYSIGSVGNIAIFLDFEVFWRNAMWINAFHVLMTALSFVCDSVDMMLSTDVDIV